MNVDGVSIGQYSCKDSEKEDYTRDLVTSILQESIKMIEQKDSQLIRRATFSLDVISQLLTDMTDENGYLVNVETLRNMHQDEASLYFFACQLNSNASTQAVHTECNKAYTLIGVPRQVHDHRLKFSFRTLKSGNLWVKMDACTTFIYSACMLTHKQ
eukprot:10125363-Ditylum_brightwellii.AAC.1